MNADTQGDRLTVIRRSDGREWRIEPSDGGIPLVFGDGKYDHDPPRVASGLESALADQLAAAVVVTDAGIVRAERWMLNEMHDGLTNRECIDAIVNALRGQ